MNCIVNERIRKKIIKHYYYISDGQFIVQQFYKSKSNVNFQQNTNKVSTRESIST